MVEKVEPCTGEKTAVDDRCAEQDAEFGRGVNAAGPSAGAEVIEIFGMFAHEQCLGFAVAMLLFEVGADGGAAVMPNEGSRVEAGFLGGMVEGAGDGDGVARAAGGGVGAAGG